MPIIYKPEGNNSWENLIERINGLNSKPYENKYVCFVDILGAKDLFLNSKTPREVSLPNLFMNELKESSNEYVKNIEIVLFSDCAYIIAGENNIEDLLLYVSILTGKLLWHTSFFSDIKYKYHLLRGGLTYGMVYSDDKLNFVVGPAMVEAYLLEGKANFPRILVDEKIIERRGLLNIEDAFISKDNDGKYYINFMYIIKRLRKFSSESLNAPIEWVRCMKSQFGQSEGEFKKLTPKYEWMENYLTTFLKY